MAKAEEFGDTVRVGVNSTVPLSVAITAPTNNAVLSAPATFTVTAVPSGGTPPYVEMDFYLGTNPIGVVYYNSPFTTTISNLLVGSYKISAVITDDYFNTATNSKYHGLRCGAIGARGKPGDYRLRGCGGTIRWAEAAVSAGQPCPPAWGSWSRCAADRSFP